MSIVYVAIRPATAKRAESFIAVETTIEDIQAAISHAAFRATIRYLGDEPKHKAAMVRWTRGVDVEVYPPTTSGPAHLLSNRAQA